MNNFKADLQYSLEERENAMFDNFYYRIFPNIAEIKFCEDMATQRKGIDKIIYFENGNSFSVDEKKRRVDYGDILLELWSVYESRIRGWLYTTRCDYIVYAVMPTRKVFLLPTLLLKRAWLANRNEWLRTYKTVIAKNKTYTTHSIPIPTNVLLDAIAKEMSHKFVNTS